MWPRPSSSSFPQKNSALLGRLGCGGVVQVPWNSCSAGRGWCESPYEPPRGRWSAIPPHFEVSPTALAAAIFSGRRPGFSQQNASALRNGAVSPMASGWSARVACTPNPRNLPRSRGSWVPRQPTSLEMCVSGPSGSWSCARSTGACPHRRSRRSRVWRDCARARSLCTCRSPNRK